MGTISILKLTNQDERFYPLLGPFLSQRAIAGELGGPLWDDAGKVWFVALDGDNVVGFAAYTLRAGRATFCSDYVLPAQRGERIYDRLMHARLTDAGRRAGQAVAVVRQAAQSTYTRHGFSLANKQREMKNYVRMERPLTAEGEG